MNHINKTILYILFIILTSLFLTVLCSEFRFFFTPDPHKVLTYKRSFHNSLSIQDKKIVEIDGFFTSGSGLQLTPGTAGKIVLSFNKKQGNGCLLRTWFYGDGGKQQPNRIGVSTDNGQTFQTVAINGNFIGSVFDLTPWVKQSNHFLLQFEAENTAPFTPVVIDQIEIVIVTGESVRPVLPDLPKALGLLLLMGILFYCVLQKNISKTQLIAPVFLCFIIALAAYLRWNELLRVSGTILDDDAVGYLQYAKKMALISSTGFYSAQFGLREPFFIFVVKVFFFLFGDSDTHLRFVSFTFSLAVIILTYKMGSRWFNELVGLSAALILAIHPYLIELSARGLRGELYTVLLLLFLYFGYIKTDLTSTQKTVLTGFVMGLLFLTRSESFSILPCMVFCYIFTRKSRWGLRMAVAAIVIGTLLCLPHFYNTYKKYGDPFYAANRHARFYANREFAGKPGFPTQVEIAKEGMYIGPKITPFEYLFKLHTPKQIIKSSGEGFAKIHLAMPFSYAAGKGNLRQAVYILDDLKNNFELHHAIESVELFVSLLKNDILDYCIFCAVLLSFVAGIFLLILNRCWIIFFFMAAFQAQTSFIAYLGIDARLTAHSYPLIALCCGYAICWVCSRSRIKN